MNVKIEKEKFPVPVMRIILSKDEFKQLKKKINVAQLVKNETMGKIILSIER